MTTSLFGTLANFIALFAFVALSNQLLLTLFDWSKWVHAKEWANPTRLRLFILLLSLALGTLLFNFFQVVISICQSLFVSLK
ncbi:DUF1146 family protein [Streptococcus sp. DD12]|uniref:DUF1146 family protein n=1 Tax=Streptococcus sp. DD12 TaxID=1777880 RepID=UPI000791B2F6|nr:DUF1146 family protein [Streptococcus sp. DD12]KXT77021.1 hypothetical protein STRDD12_00155 [Streptococcus sp. DD12]